jgi:hypothetical protein
MKRGESSTLLRYNLTKRAQLLEMSCLLDGVPASYFLIQAFSIPFPIIWSCIVSHLLSKQLITDPRLEITTQNHLTTSPSTAPSQSCAQSPTTTPPHFFPHRQLSPRNSLHRVLFFVQRLHHLTEHPPHCIIKVVICTEQFSHC